MSGFIKCPHCGTEVESSVSVCRGCGAEVIHGASCSERTGCGCLIAAIAFLAVAFGAEAAITALKINLPPNSPPVSALSWIVIVPAWIVGAIIGGFMNRGTRFVRSYRHRS